MPVVAVLISVALVFVFIAAISATYHNSKREGRRKQRAPDGSVIDVQSDATDSHHGHHHHDSGGHDGGGHDGGGGGHH